jgi:hypothetical protein
MTIFTRADLERAFPKHPRIVASMERLDRLLSTTNEEGQTLTDQLEELAANFADGGDYQGAAALLTAIAEAQGTLGVFEKVADDQVILHEVDSADDLCLVPRNKLMSYVGTGPTASRPILSSQRRAVYFDTSLAPAGKPTFWTGTAWVDASGSIV